MKPLRELFAAAEIAERQTFAVDAEFRAVEGKDRTLEGYALTWNTLSSDRGGYRVRLKPGSPRFANPTAALFNHSRFFPIGTTGNGSLRLSTDEKGVKVSIDLPDTQLGRDVFALVRDRYIGGMSFAWQNPKGSQLEENGLQIFDAESFDVDEVSIVGDPAFLSSSISVAPPKVQRHSIRTSQSLRLERLRINSLQLPPAAAARRR